jgi:hypothetical protein
MEAAAQGLHFVPELAARKYSPAQYAAAYGQAEGGRIGAANGGIQGLMPRRGYSHGGSHWYNPLSWLGGEDETQDVNLYGEPETITYNDKTYVMPSQVYPTRGEHQLEGTALEAYIEKNEAMKKFYRENKNMMPKTWINKAQGGRIGYADGSDDEARAMEQAAEDLKRTMHSFTEKRGPLYIDEDYDLDVPLTEYEKELREMPKEEREEQLRILKSILRQRGNIGRDIAIPSGGKTGKERQMELLNWGTNTPDEETGYKDEYSMRHRAAEYLDRPYFDEHYETGEHFNQGGRIGAQEGGLMDMGGMEKDYRQEGGFVPIGGQEKADDVPARLSKNEFVFTADAVRAAGGGDIDAGAEIMENVMDNLEAGGKVSEESQGLEGAQEMFANAQELEKRII